MRALASLVVKPQPWLQNYNRNQRSSDQGAHRRPETEGRPKVCGRVGSSPKAKPHFRPKKGAEAPLASYEACHAEGVVAPARGINLGPAEDDVVGHLDAEDAPGLAELTRDLNIGAGGRRIA